MPQDLITFDIIALTIGKVILLDVIDIRFTFQSEVRNVSILLTPVGRNDCD